MHCGPHTVANTLSIIGPVLCYSWVPLFNLSQFLLVVIIKNTHPLINIHSFFVNPFPPFSNPSLLTISGPLASLCPFRW